MRNRRRAPEQRFGPLQEQDVPDAQQVVCASTDTSPQRLTHLAQGRRLLWTHAWAPEEHIQVCP